jgi:cation diffusion facilitator family transporter
MASSSKAVIYAALVGNAFVATTKFIAAALTGSSAMLSEGIHSVVDTGNQALLLHGLRRARKPADERFPFGHGKEIYFWSFVVSILIFAVGAGVSLYEGVHHLIHPSPIEKPFVNYIVLTLSLAFEGAAWYFALVKFRAAKGDWGYFEAVHKGKDPSLFVVLFEDSAAMLGLMAAFVGVLLSDVTGIPHFDGAASVVIGIILGGTAVWLAYETKGLLIGESANPRIVRGIRELALKYDEIQHVNEVLTLHMGPDFIVANISVDFDNAIPAQRVKRTIQSLDEAIKAAFPHVQRIFVEAEARRPIASAPGAEPAAED